MNKCLLVCVKRQFLIFLENQHRLDFGIYRCIAILPTSHKKKDTLWLPYDFVLDLTKALVLTERRNFTEYFAKAIQLRYGLMIDKKALMELPLDEAWKPYNGQMIRRNYFFDKCFRLKLDSEESLGRIRKVRLNPNESSYEWECSVQDLLSFYSDPRFQGFLYNAGFSSPSDQLQLSLLA